MLLRSFASDMDTIFMAFRSLLQVSRRFQGIIFCRGANYELSHSGDGMAHFIRLSRINQRVSHLPFDLVNP